MGTVVKSRIVNQDDQAHGIYANMCRSKWPSGERKKRAVKLSVLAGQEINLSQTLHVEKPTLWDVKTDHPAALYTLYTRSLSGLAVGGVQRNSTVIRYLNWTPEGSIPQWGGDPSP